MGQRLRIPALFHEPIQYRFTAVQKQTRNYDAPGSAGTARTHAPGRNIRRVTKTRKLLFA